MSDTKMKIQEVQSIEGGLMVIKDCTFSSEKILESVDDYNKRIAEERTKLQESLRKTGVACPKCGRELEWTGASYVLTSYPPQPYRQARCTPCGLEMSLEIL